MKRKRLYIAIAKLCGKTVIIHLHSSDPKLSVSGEYKNIYRASFRLADKIIVLSQTWLHDTVSSLSVPKDKIEVLYNPCPVVNPSWMHERQHYILFAGTLNRRKGYYDLIKAFSLIALKHPEWSLILAGNGEIEEGKSLARELGVDNRVEFIGWVNGKEKDNVFRHASIYCLPSYSEGFPMEVLDAWAYHLPVVTTPVGGLPDVVVDGENCLLFTPGDTYALANQLDRLMSDSALYQKLTSASAHFANDRFNINELSKQLEEIYQA